MLTRDNSNVHQKGLLLTFLSLSKSSNLLHNYFQIHLQFLGIMQLAMLAPYSNLATSVAAALVPTLLGPKMKGAEENESVNISKNTEDASADEGDK